MRIGKAKWALRGVLSVCVGVFGCNGSGSSDGLGGDPSEGSGGKAAASGGKASGSGGKSTSGGSGTGDGGSESGGASSSGGEGGVLAATGGEGGDPNPGSGGRSGEGTGGEGTGGEGTGGAPSVSYPALPPVLSLSGCEAIALGPLCSVDQSEGAFTANCGGVVLDGEIDEEGHLLFGTETLVVDESTTRTIECVGELRYGRLRTTSCVRTTAVGEQPPTEEQCSLASDPQVQPSYGCLDLPETIEDLVLCVEGAANEGETMEAGDCRVLQDGCNYQLECENGAVFEGSVSATGISFNQALVALADAQGDTPAFLKGDSVNHSCALTFDGSTVTGTCGAGRQGRGGTNTSVCAASGTGAGLPPVCGLLAPSAEHLLVLDSCDALKEGEGATPGIGEPVCSVRQNNCVWEVQCGRTLKYEGLLGEGGSKFEWTLPTGTPCEISFDATGKMTGKCQVPGQAACPLSSKAPTPGGEACPTLPEGTGFHARGCGDAQGTGLVCSGLVQHGCNYVGNCSFRGIPLVVAGETMVDELSSRNRLEFTGLPGWECHAEEATQSDIENDARVAGEWFGDCESESGGLCRNNYDPVTNPTGLRGLQLFFDQP